jgi:hypothetical protein
MSFAGRRAEARVLWAFLWFAGCGRTQEELSRGAGNGAADELCGSRTAAAGLRLEPLLQAICDFLDKQPALIERVRRDLVRGLRQPDHGRRGLIAARVLRALVLRLKLGLSRAARTHRRWNNAASVHQILPRRVPKHGRLQPQLQPADASDTTAIRGKNLLTALNIRPCARRSRIIGRSVRASSTKHADAQGHQ